MHSGAAFESLFLRGLRCPFSSVFVVTNALSAEAAEIVKRED